MFFYVLSKRLPFQFLMLFQSIGLRDASVFYFYVLIVVVFILFYEPHKTMLVSIDI